MFNVTRPFPAPECLSKKQYNNAEVVDLLKPMFYEKCYLCEQDGLSDPEIEHFDPHEKDDLKKFAWENLFYACSRCNGIKSNVHKDLIDCCDSSVDVFRAIKCIMPSIPSGLVEVTSMHQPSDIKTNNTAALLERCYNDAQTALRNISRASLSEKIFDHYVKFINYRIILKSKESSDEERQLAKGRIKKMLTVKFPFSVFWRWHLLSDDFLRKELQDIIDF
jgi:hypothetical protein